MDVTYINGTTWAEETVQCRQTGNPTPVKVESYTLDGVLNEDRAYRIGMRRLLGYQLRARNWHFTQADANEWFEQYQTCFVDKTPDGSQNRLWMLRNMGRVL